MSVPGIIFWAAVAAVACALLAWGLVYGLIGRPIRRLTDRIRRVGAGDFSGRVGRPGRHGLAELGREIDVMCDRLAEAQQEAARETAARIAAIEQLRHADRLTSIGQLAAGIAHELGTPLNVVAERARLIGGEDVTPDELRESIQVIVEQSERMTTIIRQFLDFARRRGPQLEAMDLRDVTGAAVSMLTPVVEKGGVEVHLDHIEAPLPVRLDATQIQQVITNLVINGAQAMPRGGRLEVSTSRAAAVPPAEHGGSPGPYACLRIRDEGEGIPAASIPHLFEPYFTTKGVGEGTGLGLPIAGEIIKEHRGWIEVASEPGRGSCFSIFLPLHTEPRGSEDQA